MKRLKHLLMAWVFVLVFFGCSKNDNDALEFPNSDHLDIGGWDWK